MGFLRFDKEKLLPILISRTVIFFFLMCLLTLLLFAAGTVQGFVDSTLLLLLKLYVILGIFLSFASISGFILGLGRFLKNKKVRYLLRTIAYFFLALFAAITVLAVIFIITVSGGNAPQG
jgi:hypothetical protein